MDFNNTKAGDVDYILKQLEKNINVFIEKREIMRKFSKQHTLEHHQQLFHLILILFFKILLIL